MEGIQPVVIDLTDRLENPGDSFSLTGRVDIDAYTTGEKSFSLSDGVSYDVVLTNAGDGILVTGLVRAAAEGACDRCLEPARFDIAGEIEEYYLFEEPEDAEEFEDGFELVTPERTVDLSGAIWDAMVMDTPFVVLCRPDCAGLCPTCGANLNDGPCGCAEAAEQAWVDSDDNPFAALRNLKLEDRDEA